MEIKIYAPIIIPTLNRYDHFHQCLDSLEKCYGADKTEVYVGLDYPPADKYVDGWKKNDTYLHEKEQQNAFKKLVVFRRNHNCGVGTFNSNAAQLRSYISEKYDRFIFSEDDNVFSPNFLEYINKGLEMFRDDSSVLAINGYCHPYNFKFDGNNYFRNNVDFSAWGYGIWTDRFQQFNKEIREEEIFKETTSIKNFRKAKSKGYNRLLGYINCILPVTMKTAWITDAVLSSYMTVKDMVVITPAITKVRNIGWDLSGQSFSTKGMSDRQQSLAIVHNKQTIDESFSFDYEGNPLNYFQENQKVIIRESDGKLLFLEFCKKLKYQFLKRLIKRILWPLLQKMTKYRN